MALAHEINLSEALNKAFDLVEDAQTERERGRNYSKSRQECSFLACRSLYNLSESENIGGMPSTCSDDADEDRPKINGKSKKAEKAAASKAKRDEKAASQVDAAIKIQAAKEAEKNAKADAARERAEAAAKHAADAAAKADAARERARRFS